MSVIARVAPLSNPLKWTTLTYSSVNNLGHSPATFSDMGVISVKTTGVYQVTSVVYWTSTNETVATRLIHNGNYISPTCVTSQELNVGNTQTLDFVLPCNAADTIAFQVQTTGTNSIVTTIDPSLVPPVPNVFGQAGLASYVIVHRF